MTQVIAEIGWNHMGDDTLAKQMIQEAANSGASFAKFQTWSVSRLKAGEWDSDGRREIYNSAELTPEMHSKYIDFCSNFGINFMSSVFSVEDAKFLKGLNLNVVKVPSFEVTNKALLDFCDKNFGELIVSTGTATQKEIDDLKNSVDVSKTTVMHCVSSYPCDINNANLPRLQYLQESFPSVGYSDHVCGIDASIYSLKYDLKYIEKHFTTDHNLPGRDNKFAILPEELKALTSHIEKQEKAFIDHGIDYQAIETSARTDYRGRFNKV